MQKLETHSCMIIKNVTRVSRSHENLQPMSAAVAMSQRVYTPPSLGFTAACLIAPISFVGRPSRSDLELLHVT